MDIDYDEDANKGFKRVATHISKSFENMIKNYELFLLEFGE